ncbi:MAG: hypothetical protein A2Z72_08200 [Omnitrophica bacterium RBG_13_46_9]|nr:MAG: hypothetical protein A2Z72_08200 [Omnitrophica bacterium RBG_13_46_9]
MDESIESLKKLLEEKEKELQKLQRLKSDYSSIISNEFREPLISIKNVASLLPMIRKGRIDRNEAEFFDILMRNSNILIQLLDDLLDVCKMETGEFGIRRGPVNMMDLVKEVKASFISKAKERGIELKERFLIGNEVEIYVDRDRISQVFSNLVTSAFKLTEKGHIEFSIEDKGDMLECYVADTGIGISEEELPEVFNKFQHFDRVASPEMKGLGLSLSVAKGIVTLHKGNIWAESKLNEGTKFSFTLPKYTAQEAIKEYVISSMEYSVENKSHFSILKFELNNIDNMQKEIGKERCKSVKEALERLIKNNIRQQTDAIFRTTNAVFTTLPSVRKEGVLIIIERLERGIKEYLSRERLDKKVIISCKSASFPEDGNNYEKYMLE